MERLKAASAPGGLLGGIFPKRRTVYGQPAGKASSRSPLVTFINAASLFRSERGNRLANYLPWSMPVGRRDEGIILLKAGGFMRCYGFTCPDTDSVSDSFILDVARSVNAGLKSLGEGWAWHVDCVRGYTGAYPGCTWGSELGFIIDKRREEMFRSEDEHFVNDYVLSVTYRAKDDIYRKARGVFYGESGGGQGHYDRARFGKELDAFRAGCSDAVSYFHPSIRLRGMNNDETVTYLHTTCSMQGGERICPDDPQFMDLYLTDDDVESGTTLRIGEYYCPVIALRTFPNQSFPAMLRNVTSAAVELRWTTRFIAVGGDKINSILTKYQKKYHGSSKSIGALVYESASHEETTRTDPRAAENEGDVEAAMIEQGNDVYTFGYYTADIMVWDRDYEAALRKASYVSSIVNRAGFGAKSETVNNLSAWLGMMPGNVLDNVRRPVVSSGNLSCLIPLSSMWQGNRRNLHTEANFGCSAPLLVCQTNSSTPFFLNLNIGDVGHGFVFGPTGAGKSTLLCLMESQFLKYRGANVIILDKDKSARGVTVAQGGVYIEPGSGDCAFQPLHDLESDRDITWAAEFIEVLLGEQHVACGASMREAIVRGLRQLAKSKAPGMRTISTFQMYVTYRDNTTGENTIKAALEPYTVSGQYGKIFDAQETSVSLTKWLMIEMGTLMKMGSAAVTPALMYIFRLIEKIYTTADGDPTGDPTLLVLDESWVFLDNPYFRKTIEDWLLTLRKKHVFVWFATQEVARVAKSQIATTIISQCPTKIYLADSTAASEIIADSYRQMGLTDDEIAAISRGRAKRDYFYKSTEGCRLFQLGLDPMQLALLAPGKAVLDGIEAKYGKNSLRPLARQILDAQGFAEHRRYFTAREKKGRNT